MKKYKNPTPTVDIIIEIQGGIVLIERVNPPRGWALPGGYVDYGETLEAAAIREAREETSLDVDLIGQFHTYSDPKRDSRRHNISTVFIARPSAPLDPMRKAPLALDGDGSRSKSAMPPLRQVARAASDAKNIGTFTRDRLPSPIVFDHAEILADYFRVRASKKKWVPAVPLNASLTPIGKK
ncbi:MAG: NUDIX hydrolase [Nitrospinae bacterium]|nr:NUDIX hydrolase [Nitrospinota bacterium]